MGAIKREPTPAGPVTELFDRLHAIHLAAGQPSIREIATGIGRRGHQPLHHSQHVPRSADPEVGLPRAGRRGTARRYGGVQGLVASGSHRRRGGGGGGGGRSSGGAASNGESALLTEKSVLVTTQPSLPSGATGCAPTPSRRLWSNEIPQRNTHFTGRVTELDALRANLIREDRPHPQAQLISGMGGVGKTEIATEYIHRHRDKYEIIWWIRAEHTDRVRDALVKLGQRLDVRPAAGRRP